MRTLRWAADLAVKGDPASAAVGMKPPEALGDCHMLQPDQQTFIDATLAAILRPVEAAYPEDSGSVLVQIEESDG